MKYTTLILITLAVLTSVVQAEADFSYQVENLNVANPENMNENANFVFSNLVIEPAEMQETIVEVNVTGTNNISKVWMQVAGTNISMIQFPNTEHWIQQFPVITGTYVEPGNYSITKIFANDILGNVGSFDINYTIRIKDTATPTPTPAHPSSGSGGSSSSSGSSGGGGMAFVPDTNVKSYEKQDIDILNNQYTQTNFSYNKLVTSLKIKGNRNYRESTVVVSLLKSNPSAFNLSESYKFFRVESGDSKYITNAEIVVRMPNLTKAYAMNSSGWQEVPVEKMSEDLYVLKSGSLSVFAISDESVALTEPETKVISATSVNMSPMEKNETVPTPETPEKQAPGFELVITTFALIAGRVVKQ